MPTKIISPLTPEELEAEWVWDGTPISQRPYAQVDSNPMQTVLALQSLERRIPYEGRNEVAARLHKDREFLLMRLKTQIQNSVTIEVE